MAKTQTEPSLVARVSLKAVFSVPVSGKTLDEAIKNTASLKFRDVIAGEPLDFKYEIIGVEDENGWPI